MLLLLALSRIPVLGTQENDSASSFTARIGHIGLVIISLVYILNTVWQTQQ
jgi:hypothetical protein